VITAFEQNRTISSGTIVKVINNNNADRFNKTYSLGNDINAAGGPYYNAAAKRNYYVGVSFQMNNGQKKVHSSLFMA